MRRPCLIVCAALAAACSLDEGGTSTGSFDDGGADLGDAAAGPCTTPASACGALPAGWTPVAFAENAPGACPAGWTARTGVDDLVAGADACQCACTPTNPTCDGADLDTNISLTGLCLLGGKTLPMASSACKSIGETNLDNYMKIPPVAMTGGDCAVSATANTAALTTTPVRECEPPPACAGEVCAGVAPSAFLACVEKTGDEATCPAGFPNRHLVGDGVDAQCGNGTCACGATPSCGPATLSLYSDNACVTKVLDAPANDKCNPTNAGSAKFQSYKYQSAPSMQCAASGVAAANPVLVGQRTACCR